MRPENLILLALMAGLLFLMFSRTRRQQREAQQVQSGLQLGAEVMTTAGLFAKVVALDDQSVTLETSPGQTSRWDRRAVARILAPGQGVGAVDDGEDDDLARLDDRDGDLDEGAGARLEHGSVEGGTSARPSGPDTTPPDRP